MTVRTRFAPSPTGELHLGNARTAVLNWLFARHAGGSFVLRLEDTDPGRAVAGAERAILEGLDWLGLERDEDPVVGGRYGPYRQSERLGLYRERAERLLDAGAAFRCYCLPAELAERRRARVEAGGTAAYDGRCRDLPATKEEELRRAGRRPAVRFRIEPGTVRYRDRLRGALSVDGADLGDTVILRSDGRPTYNFAVVVDDLLMEITHVIRGSGHLSNTPKQVLLYQALGGEPPEFVHVPTVLAPGGEKMSKRAGAPGLSRYQKEGFHPDAVVNYLSLLSWAPPEGREVLAREELVEEIDLDRLGTSEPILDRDKMRWLSGQHIRREPPDALARLLEPWVDRRRLGLSERDLRALAEIVRRRIHLFADAASEAERIYAPVEPEGPAAAALAGGDARRVLEATATAWAGIREWRPEPLAEALTDAGDRLGVRGRALYAPVRAALTGELEGPEVPDVAYALGRDRALGRLRAALRAAEVGG